MEARHLSVGAFPRPVKLHARYQPTGQKDFDKNFKLDAQMDWLFYNRKMPQPGNAKVLDFPRSARLVSDAKKALATLSWGTWFSETNAAILRELYERLQERTISTKDTLERIHVAMNLACTATESTVATSDHILSSLSVATLAQRDHFLKQMDRDLPQETKESLRGVSFQTPTLFAGKVREATDTLKDVRQASSLTRPLTVTVQAPSGNSSSKKPQRKVSETPWQGGQSSFRASRGRGRGQGGRQEGGQGSGGSSSKKRRPSNRRRPSGRGRGGSK